MYLYVISIHSDENMCSKVINSFNSLLNIIPYWNNGVKEIKSKDLRPDPLTRKPVEEENVEPKLKGLRYFYHNSLVKDIELILKEYYETFLKVGYTIKVNVYNLKRKLPIEEFYANEYIKDKKVSMFSEYLDEELESFFNVCSLSQIEFNIYLEYLNNKINYLNSEKLYKKIEDSTEETFPYEPCDIRSKEYSEVDNNPLVDVNSYLLQFTQEVFVKKTPLVELNRIFIPEIKSIKPVSVDFSIGLRVSDIKNLLENVNLLEKELEKEEEKKEKEYLETKAVVEPTVDIDEDQEYMKEPMFLSYEEILDDKKRDHEKEFSKFENFSRTLEPLKTDEEIVNCFLNYFTTQIVSEVSDNSTINKTTKWYIQNEFCYFVLNPIDYIQKINLTLGSKLEEISVKTRTTKLNDLMKLAKNAINNYMKDKKILVLKYYDIYPLSLYNLLKDNKNISKNMYELLIHTDIDNKLWTLVETPQDKSVNEETIRTLIELYSSKCLEKNTLGDNILSSNLHKEFLGYLKFNKYSFYLDLISNISFTIHMKKLGYKTKRTSSGNAYKDIEIKESFTKEWLSCFNKDNNKTDFNAFVPDWLNNYESFTEEPKPMTLNS